MFYSQAFNTFLKKRIGGLPTESYRKARLLLNAVGVSLIFSLAYLPISFITEFVIARYAMYVSVLTMTTFLLVIRPHNWKLVAHLFVATVWSLTLVLIYFSGDVMSGMLSWLVITPLVALMILPFRMQWLWLGITILSVLLFLWLPKPETLLSYTSPWPAFYNTSLVVGLVGMIYLITLTFQKQQHHLLVLAEGQNEELRAAEEELRQSMEELSTTQEVLNEQNLLIGSRQEKTEKYLNTLITLAMCKGILEGDKQIAYDQILSTTAQALKTTRVSIWHYQPNDEHIECMALFDNGVTKRGEGVKLYAKDFENYFKAILSEKVIVATDARNHLATHEFTESYLKPLDIYSMLDAPYIENGKFQGVICCEHQGEIKNWDQEDVLFVNSIADLICMAINSSQRKEFEQEILLQREQILQQNEKLVSFAEEIKLINQSLESRVAERTAALNEQNKQLTEYAFVNAHLLRGPLSRILGLAEVIRHTQSREEILKLVELLDFSTKELDAVVHRITTILNEGRKFDRNSLRE